MNNLNAEILKLCRILEPRDDLTVTQWAEKKRELAGRGRFRARPWQREIMDTATDETIRETTLVKPAQFGGSTIAENVAGYFIEHDPKLLLVVFPQVELGEAWSQTRLMTMLEESCPGLIGERRGRDAANTKVYKEFPGGNIAIIGANSPAGFRMRDRQILILDDLNGCGESAGNEGDIEMLAENRLASYSDAFTFRASTPTVKRTILSPTGQPITLSSRIYQAYERSDQRKWFCCCPRCGQWSVLRWDCVKWPKGQPEDAIYRPDCCNTELDASDLCRMADGGEWRKTAVSLGHAGFQISKLAGSFAPHRGYRTMLHELAVKWLAAQNETEKLKVFINNELAEDFGIHGYAPDIKTLFERVERFGPERVPLGVQYITAFCDVQHDRLEMTVRGWGAAEESWVIEHRLIVGAVTNRETWDQLDEAFRCIYPREDGKQMNIGCLLIDSADGQTQREVYKFVKPRQTRRIYAARGSSDSGAPLSRQARPTKYAKNRDGIFLVTIGTHVAKGTLFTRLKIKEPGPGYVHFSDTLTTDWFNQLAAEELQPRKRDGKTVEVWVAISARNEALDCMAGNEAAKAVARPQIREAPEYQLTHKPASEAQPEAKPEEPIIGVELLSSNAPDASNINVRRSSKFRF